MGLSPSMEVEAKYRVPDHNALESRLRQLPAQFLHKERHRDTYLRHPCRDFKATDEALRIRVVDGKPWVTYKGPRREGAMKIRPEIELPLGESDLDAWLRIWNALGFHEVATVVKNRRTFQFSTRTSSSDSDPLLIAIDSVENVGDFAEIERVVNSEQEIEQARSDIERLAHWLGLDHLERRSYLALLLDRSP